MLRVGTVLIWQTNNSADVSIFFLVLFTPILLRQCPQTHQMNPKKNSINISFEMHFYFRSSADGVDTESTCWQRNWAANRAGVSVGGLSEKY